MTESLEMLAEAEKKYESAIDNIDGVNIKLQDFHREMKKVLDENSAEHKQQSGKLRAATYSSAGGVTVGLIIPDIFGCLGTCSVVGNAIAWGTSIPTVEVSIAK